MRRGNSTGGDVERTPITREEREFAEDVMTSMGEEISCLEWIQKKKHARTEQRLLVITKYRLVTLKIGTMSKAVCRNGHLLELKRAIATDRFRLDLKFAGFDLAFASGAAPTILKTLLTNYRNMTFADESRADIQVPDDVRAALGVEDADPGPNGVDAFLRALDGHIDMAGGQMQRSTAIQVRSSFLDGGTGLELHNITEPEEVAVFECLAANPFELIAIHDVKSTTGSGRVVARLAEHLSSSTTLSHLELVSAGCTKDGMQPLSRALLDNNALPLEIIDVSGNNLGDKGIGMLARAVAEMASLRSLALCGCGGSAKSMKELFSALENSVSMGMLDALRVNDNTLDRKGSDGLIRLLTSASVPSLHHLGVGNTQVDCSRLFDAVAQQNTPLHSLDVSSTRVRREDAVALCAALATGSTMADINLAGSGLEARLLEAITASLFFNGNLDNTGLALSRNDLGPLVGTKIASMVAVSRTIHSLSLDDCNLGDTACGFIITTLVESPFCRIEHLSLSANVRNGENEQSAAALGRLISERQNLALKSLHVAGGGADRPQLRWNLEPFFEALPQCTFLASVDVSGNGLGDPGVTALCNGLKRNNSLQHLKCTDNEFTHSTFRTLHHCLNFNRSLRRIDPISSRTADAAEAARIMDIQAQVQDALRLNCERAAARQGRRA